MNRTSCGGLFSFLAFVASAIFLGLAVFGVGLGSVPEVDAGLFSGFLAFALERVGL